VPQGELHLLWTIGPFRQKAGDVMIDVKKETERLVKRFISQLEALGAQMSAETKAVSWSMAAEVIAAGLQAVAVGSLLCDGREATLAMPVKQVPRPTTKLKRINPRHYNVPQVHAKGPQPSERAKHYEYLLNGRHGRWSRRDGKVQYTVCDAKIFPDSKKTFYRMRRLDNGEEKWVKFTSIVSDWKHFPDA
jgi:hypothetical protein